MLDGLDPGEFDEWLAYREIEPDPVDRIITILRLGFVYLCNAWGAKIDLTDIDPYMKATGEAGSGGGGEVSPQQAAAMMTAAFGPRK